MGSLQFTSAIASINFNTVDSFPAPAAAYGGHTAIVKLFLAQGANIDQRDDLGLTPLYYAAESGHADVVQDLVKGGAKVDSHYFMLWGIGLWYAICGNGRIKEAVDS